MTNKLKTAKQIERHFKGVSNHWRIDILLLIEKNEGLGVGEVSEMLKGNVKTISEHIRKLKLAGLIDKNYFGRTVEHRLSPYGKTFARFIRSFHI